MLALATVSLATGLAIALRPARPVADVTVWTFTTTDAAADRAAATAFTAITGHTVRVERVAAPALDVRLSALFMAGPQVTADPARPDVVELEVQSVGKFLRGSPDDVGFLPLDGYLRRGGWGNHIVPARLQTYTYAGHVFGLPIDLHPVTLVYRHDLIDLSSATTWDALRQACLDYHRDHPGRYAIGLPRVSPDVLLLLLQQAHVDLVDANGSAHLTDAVVAGRICAYARAVAGPGQFGTDVNPAPGGAAADLAAGDVAALVLADWAVADLERAAPSLVGRLSMVPLPRFAPTDAPTASWGGTMVGIPRACPDPDRAWQFIEQTYLNRDAAIRRYQSTGVLPPRPDLWPAGAFHRPDLFFSGQSTADLYERLSPSLPARTMTPYTTTAQNLLAWVLNRTVSRVAAGDDDVDTECRGWLTDRQAQLERLIEFDRQSGRH